MTAPERQGREWALVAAQAASSARCLRPEVAGHG